MEMKITAREKMRKYACPENVYKLMQRLFYMDAMADHHKEHAWALHLNADCKVICADLVGMGTLDRSVFHPRDVFKVALAKNAHSVVLVHNHPSGNKKPSYADKMVTERMKRCGDLMGVTVVDHIIITPSSFYSFKQNSKIFCP